MGRWEKHLEGKVGADAKSTKQAVFVQKEGDSARGKKRKRIVGRKGRRSTGNRGEGKKVW